MIWKFSWKFQFKTFKTHHSVSLLYSLSKIFRSTFIYLRYVANISRFIQHRALMSLHTMIYWTHKRHTSSSIVQKKIIYLFINSHSKRLLCHRCLVMCILQNQFWLLLDGLLNWWFRSEAIAWTRFNLWCWFSKL